MILLRVCLTCFVASLAISASYALQNMVTKSELRKKQKEQIDNFEINGIRSIIRDYASAVVLIYSISNEAEDDGFIYNTSAKQRLKKHHYRIGVSSGVLISSGGIVCTTYSGIMNADNFVISVNSEARPQSSNNKITLGRSDYKAELIKAIPDMNLAFLKIKSDKKQNFPFMKLGNDAPFINGKDRVLLNSAVVIGKAKGENFVNAIKPANFKNNFSMFATGIEKLTYQKENGNYVLIAENTVTNPAIIAETAGGSILDMDGKLIGIANPSTDFIGNVNQNAIPISVIKKAIRMVIPGVLKIGSSKPLGIEFDEKQAFGITPNLRHLFKIPTKIKHFGLKVKSVNFKSIADNAGILPGDIILKFNNNIVLNTETFQNLEKYSSDTQTVSLTILRNKNLFEVEIYK